jgi:long-chain-fatty-acid--[acyl-carrier-protein] ligase
MKKKKQKTSDKARHGFFNTVIALVIKALLRLRYRVTIRGLDDISSRGRKGILFLPSHPALIDPVIMLSVLYRDFGPRSIADEFRMRKRFVNWLSKRFGTRTIPGVARTGGAGADAIMSVLSKSMEDLRNGENILLYPGGHLKRSRSEEIGATSAVQIIANSLPQVRVVLVRQMGLWGSSFSWSSGRSPDFVLALKQNLKNVLRNGIFFSPRRPVEIEFVEPDSFPRDADRITINRFMEDFYNTVADPNTYVPYLFWQDRKISIRPEPELLTTKGEIDSVSETTKKLVVEYLEELTGQSALSEKQSLAYDLGMDSLAIVEIVLWLEKEFGFQQVDTGSLKTVADVMIAAAGKGVSSLPALLKPVSAKWHSRSSANRPLCVSEGKTVCEIFLKQAKCSPDKLVICDQSSGEKTYRDIITAIIALKPFIEALPGVYIGIMLPASVGATICYLASLFAGKTPVMLNWTVGSRNMVHSLNLLGVKHVLTAQALVTRLATQGTNLTEMNDRFVFMETVAKQVSLVSKLRAYAASRLSWSCLRNSNRTDIAVILFTSGSESLPKAVPLSHKNIIANIRDIPSKVVFRENDVMIGILPPFHSFGITTAIILPLCIGLRTVYHPNPTEAPTIARLIEEYKVSIAVGTPTFLNGIARASSKKQLRTLRAAISGAEKCPASVYQVINERCPHMKLLEGYGVTECSPIVSANTEKAPMPYTIGTPMPSIEHVIIDVNTRERVAENKAGILLVRGPSVFAGYLNYDGKSPFVKYDGRKWYNTGDLVSEDTDGVLTFCGRLKRFCKIGGEMISLPAIEEVIAPHFADDSDEGPVIAVEATSADENPDLVLFTIKDTDRATVNNYLRDAGLGGLHNIRRVIKLDEIPILGTGKTDYLSLKRMM